MAYTLSFELKSLQKVINIDCPFYYQGLVKLLYIATSEVLVLTSLTVGVPIITLISLSGAKVTSKYLLKSTLGYYANYKFTIQHKQLK